MRKFYFLLCLLLLAGQAFSQTDTAAVPANPKLWRTHGSVNVNFSKVGLHNWAAGGQSSLSGLGLVNLQAHYKDRFKAWDNLFEAGYGILQQGESDQPIRKSDDRLLITSKFSRNDIFWKIGAVALADFRTQFAPGYSYPLDSLKREMDRVLISKFMSPGYLTTSLGFEYRREEHFYLILSPIASKFTFVLDDSLSAQGVYGVPAGEHMRTEFGAYLNSMIQQDIWTNVNFQSRLNLFSSYKKPSSIDVNWENLITFKINKYLNSSVSTTLIYDEDITVLRNDGTSGRATQFRYTFALGFGYKFGVVE